MVIGWIFGILIGAFVGVIVTIVMHYTKTAFGTLLIDRQNPEKDVYRFDIRGDITRLPSKHRIMLKVDPNADLSQD